MKPHFDWSTVTVLLLLCLRGSAEGCTGFDGDSGRLSFPDDGKVQNAVECWVVNCGSEVVSVTWERYSMQTSEDYVRLNGVAYFEGPVYRLPKEFNGTLTVEFYTDIDYLTTPSHFAFTWTCGRQQIPLTSPFPVSPACIETEDESGTIRYPLEGAYGRNEDRCWSILCDGDVHLSWGHLDAEPGYDFVAVNGVRYSGKNDVMMPRRVAGNVLIRFTSADGFAPRHGGFGVSWVCRKYEKPAAQPCMRFAESTSGVIAYRVGTSEDRAPDVCWEILCDSFIALTWEYSRMESASLLLNGVPYDTVPTYNLPVSFKRNLTIQFSDFAADRWSHAAKRIGFTMSWVCGPKEPQRHLEPETSCLITSDLSGALQYPLGNVLYQNNENRCWTIECDGVLSLAWGHFDIEPAFDTVRVNGHNILAPERMSSAGDATISFKSDTSDVRTGFLVQWKCRAEIDSSTGTFDFGVKMKLGQIVKSVNKLLSDVRSLIWDA